MRLFAKFSFFRIWFDGNRHARLDMPGRQKECVSDLFGARWWWKVGLISLDGVWLAGLLRLLRPVVAAELTGRYGVGLVGVKTAERNIGPRALARSRTAPAVAAKKGGLTLASSTPLNHKLCLLNIVYQTDVMKLLMTFSRWRHIGDVGMGGVCCKSLVNQFFCPLSVSEVWSKVKTRSAKNRLEQCWHVIK